MNELNWFLALPGWIGRGMEWFSREMVPPTVFSRHS